MMLKPANNESDVATNQKLGLSLARILAIFVSFAYSLALLDFFPSHWPAGLRSAQLFFYGPILRLVTSAVRVVYDGPLTHELRNHVYIWLCLAIIPYLLMAIIGRGKPADLGLRLPNKIGVRLLAVSVVLSLPFIVWMTQSDQFAPYYKPYIARAGHAAFVGFNVANMFAEHFLFHGVVLALARRNLCWPDAPVDCVSTTQDAKKCLQWLGFAQPTGGATGLTALTRWMGLPDGCVIAVCVSGVHFSLVHVSKDPRELILSLPGGMILALVAYRTNSFLVPLAIHLATAGLAYGVMLPSL